MTILLNGIQPALDENIWVEQHDFRQNRSCADLVFTLKILLKQVNEWHNKPYFVFIDFEKAIDSVNRQTLRMFLHYYGISSFKSLNTTKKTQNAAWRQVTEVPVVFVTWPVGNRILFYLHCYLSSSLIIFSGHVTEMGSKIFGDVDFADDISLIQSCKQKLQHYLNQVRDATKPFGLKINANETKSNANTESRKYGEH